MISMACVRIVVCQLSPSAIVSSTSVCQSDNYQLKYKVINYLMVPYHIDSCFFKPKALFFNYLTLIDVQGI